MKITSRGTPEFWHAYDSLPPAIKTLARKNYWLWREDSGHPSLRFKRIRKPWWSVRVGEHYRAVGGFEGGVFVWEWVGTHAEYDARY